MVLRRRATPQTAPPRKPGDGRGFLRTLSALPTNLRAEAQHVRKLWALRGLLAVELSLSTVLIATHFWPLWQARWIQDDAYISFRYAKHLVEGQGLVYNLGARVEGYTNFLWTVLAAIPLALGASDPIDFLHALGAGLWLATYALWLRLGVRLFAEGRWGAPLALIPLLDHYSFNLWFVSGMETPLVSFLTAAAVSLLSVDSVPHRCTLALASLCSVGLAMTRADGMIALTALGLAGAFLHARPLLRSHLLWKKLVSASVPLLLVYVPYQLWRLHYYGSFFPNTYYAKAAYLTDWGRGWHYLATYLELYPFACLLPVLGVSLFVARGSTRRFLVASTVCVAGVTLYVVRLGGDFMEWRFLTPITGILYPSLVLAADSVAAWLAHRILKLRALPHGSTSTSISSIAGAVAAVATVLALTMLTQRATPQVQEKSIPGQESIPLLGRYCDARQFDWGEVGRVLDEIVPQGVRIATTSAGIIPFYCDRPCLDLHGLTDPEIAQVRVDPNQRGRIGHEHWLQDFDAMRARGVQIFLPFAAPKPYALALVTPPSAGRELLSVRMPSGLYFEIEILNPAGWDVARLRQDERVVRYGDVKAARKETMQTLAESFAGYEVVDTFDVQDEVSHLLHAFEEIFRPGAPPVANFHEKMLAYAPPAPSVTVLDDGRIIDDRARWEIDNVDANYDLAVVVRYDRTGAGVYGLTINGEEVPGALNFANGTEAWDERTLTIPAKMLRSGSNQLELHRKSRQSTEIYFLWFLQNKDPRPRGCRIPKVSPFN